MNNPILHHLPLDLTTFSFVTREALSGKTLPNQCGRDFLYYALSFYYPEQFNAQSLSPQEITRRGIFGINVPPWLVWTGLSFMYVPNFLMKKGLILSINNRKIHNPLDFFLATLPIRWQSFEKSIAEIEKAINQGIVTGVDIAMHLGGMVDHVMFVYGYDDENLYVFDTHQADLEYEKTTADDDSRYIMRLPKSVAKKRWGMWGRVWRVEKK